MYKYCNGASPSGKAAVFGTAIRRFESSRPRLKKIQLKKIQLKKIQLKKIQK